MDQGRNRRRAFHGIGKPYEERYLRRFTGRTHEEQNAGRRNQGPPGYKYRRRGRHDLLEIERTDLPEDDKHTDEETEVADPVDDESFFAGVRGRLLLEPETNQQVRTQPHTFPAHEHEQEAVRQYQGQHREREQVHVGEEAAETRFVSGVPDRVYVNQETHAADDEYHHRRKRIEHETDVDVERARRNPREKHLFDNPGALGQSFEFEEEQYRQYKRQADRGTGDERDHRPRQLAQQEPVDQKTNQREDRDQKQVIGHTALLTLPFEYIEPVDIDRFPVSVNRNHHGQTNSHFGGGDGQGQKHQNVSIHDIKRSRERYQGQVGGIEHQLHRHEKDNYVAAGQDTHRPDAEKDYCHYQIGRYCNHG